MKAANYSRLMIGVSGIVAAMGAHPAGAQSTQTVPPLNNDAAAVQPVAQADSGDIIVTAQRRDESLSKTPVAVAVVSAETLAKAQVTSQQDLRAIAPGLSVRASTNSNTLNYALRGQTLDPLSDTTPGVVPYINEVQLGGTASASAFYDLQNVQVLKGPQGTLFGRSATGGAVLFTTAKPTNKFGGYVSATGGNYAYRKGEGAINVPIVPDDLLLRVSGVYQQRNGFQKNLFTNGGREGDYKRYGLRGSLTANLGSNVKNELVVDYLKSSGSSTVAVISRSATCWRRRSTTSTKA